MEQITDALKEQFAKNISLVIQQEGSKLRPYVTTGTQDTEVISFESMATHEVETRHRHPLNPDDHLHGHYAAADGAGNLEQITFKTPNISRRFVAASSHYWSATMDRNDRLNLLSDPTSHFPKMAGWAMGRHQDRIIIKAFADPVRGGRTGSEVINFDVAGNCLPLGINITDVAVTLNAQIAVGENAEIIQQRKAGLTVEKLIKAHHILKKRSFGSYDKLYFLCSSTQISDLLRDPQITNYDYNSVRALVSGEVNSFLGFTFIVSEMLGGIYDSSGDGAKYAVRDCYAFNEGAIRFNTVNGSLKKGIEEMVQYHYAKVLYYSEAFGAARDNERAIVTLKCLEQYEPATHIGSQWKQVQDADHQRGVHANIVPWQMFGAAVRSVNNADAINDAALVVASNNHIATTHKPQVVVMAGARAGAVEVEAEEL